VPGFLLPHPIRNPPLSGFFMSAEKYMTGGIDH
jgi:hypothetical protein